MLFSTEVLAANVSLFYDPTYVRTDSSGSGEAYNLLQSLLKLHHNVSTFTGTDENAWLAATASADAVIIPRLVSVPVLVNDMSAGAKNVLRSYVTSGGRLITLGADWGRGTDLDVVIFGYQIQAYPAIIYGSTNLNTVLASEPSFASAPPILPRFPSTYPLDNKTLPTNALSIYADSGLCDVMASGYGAGTLLYLGWNWVIGSNFDPQGVAAWEQVLDRAIAFTHPPQPTANAGPDQAIGEGTLVVLDGTGSSDPAGKPLTYNWSQVVSYNLPGPIKLQGADTAHPSFVAPYLTQNVTVTFVLTVSSGTNYSAPSLVNVTIQQTNNPPVADAGNDSTVKAGGEISLNGQHSYDPDGNTITSYHWSQVAGPTVNWSSSTDVPQPTFIAPTEIGAQVVFQLQVSDGMEPSTPSPGTDSGLPDTVALTVVANSVPVANVGPPQTVYECTRVVLDGTCSFDPDKGDSLGYRWEQVAGTPVVLDDPTSPRPSFVAPILNTSGTGETLQFRLIVQDSGPINPLTSEPAYVTIYVRKNYCQPACDLARASEEIIWPPDHKLHVVQILGVTVQNAPADQLTLRITGITQDEPTTGVGEGDTGPDAFIQRGEKADAVLLRAERQGTGNGRVCRVNFTATNMNGSCTGSVKISVPPNRAEGVVIDDGQNVDAMKE